MRIPHEALPAATLRAIVEEFTTRDGTDHTPSGPRIDAVLAQLESETVELHYDDETKSCNILPISPYPFWRKPA
jgi:uncharacterized protein YheU (UPF0270 family)